LKNNSQYVDKNVFLAHRRQQEADHFERVGTKTNVFTSLLTVEVNTTELCNRKCSFCPRFDENVYPNRNLHMSISGGRLIAERLAAIDYVGKISFSGFGENLLNTNFRGIVEQFAELLPKARLECNTNGDKLSKAVVDQLFKAGLHYLYINLYDGIDQIEKFETLLGTSNSEKIKYRLHWEDSDHGLILNNRSGNISLTGTDVSEIDRLKGQPCYYPFYKMFVDWNGDVLFCSNDWGREQVVGNIIQDSLDDVWFSKTMKKIRQRLAKGDRTSSPCNKCNVGGTLFGQNSFERIMEHYANSDNRK
jgi:radical SAM protein with 4Fe4S-binding SPASM domain